MPLWGKKKKNQQIKDEEILISKDQHGNRIHGKHVMERKNNEKSMQTTVIDSKGQHILAKNRKSGFGHLLLSKYKNRTSFNSKNKIRSNIGEIPKPIIATDSNDSSSSTARATPLSKNVNHASSIKNTSKTPVATARNKKKTSSSINSIFNRSSKKKKNQQNLDGNSETKFSFKSEGEENEFVSFASKSSNFDSPLGSPVSNGMLNEDQTFLADFNINDIHNDHISTSNVMNNHDPTLTFQYQEEQQNHEQQLLFGEKNSIPTQTENDQTERLKVLSNKQLYNGSKTARNSANAKNPNETKALGDDLTVSTVTSAFLAPGQNNSQNINLISTNPTKHYVKIGTSDNSGGIDPSGIYIPQFPKMSHSKSNHSNYINENFPSDTGVGFETTLSPNTQDLIRDQRRQDKLISLTRSTLRRASNRSSLPAHLAKVSYKTKQI